MSSYDESTDYVLNPFYKYKEPSDYSLFYASLFLCFFIALFLLIINIYFCCFSEHKHYWTDSYTGNYFILPFWVRSPSAQAPIDLQELEWVIKPKRPIYQTTDYLELQRKESDI